MTTTPTRRQARFAKMWRSMSDSVHQQVLTVKRDVLADLPNRLVELGPGCGSNFVLYPAGTHVIAIEPNPLFDDDLHQTASEHGVDIEIHRQLADATLDDASIDAVVSTLVLCSVPDVPALLAEIERILAPGGQLLYVEHVIAPRRGLRRAYQRTLRRPWRWLGDGCDTCARTATHLEQSGLEFTPMTPTSIASGIDPTNLVIWGTAVRSTTRA